MAKGNFRERQRQLIADLTHLAAEQSGKAREVVDDHAVVRDRAETSWEKRRSTLRRKHEEERTRLQEDHDRRREEISTSATERLATIDHEHQSQLQRLERKASRSYAEVRKRLDEAIWLAESVYEGSEDQPRDQYTESLAIIQQHTRYLEHRLTEGAELLRRRRQQGVQQNAEPGDVRPATDDASEELALLATKGRELIDAIRGLRLPRLFIGSLPLILPVLTGGITAVVIGVLHRWTSWDPVDSLVTGSSVMIAVLLLGAAWQISRRNLRELFGKLVTAHEAGMKIAELCIDTAAEKCEEEEHSLLTVRDRDISAAKGKYDPLVRKVDEIKSERFEEIESTYPARRAGIEEEQATSLSVADSGFAEALEHLDRAHAEVLDAEQERHDRTQHEEETAYREQWDIISTRWHEGMDDCQRRVEDLLAEASLLFNEWENPAWEDWVPPATTAPSIRFGRHHVDRASIPGSLPDDDRLATACPVSFDLPATLDFPNHCSLLLLMDDESREEALNTMQAVMLRLLTLIPPGKARFTIIDPIGLGQSFSGFMHLGDYDEKFVSSRIWTETRHIEQQLTDLTEHMENVIQTYLRNEFETIADYNIEAEEIAEPYRFLVISDFPSGFSDIAVKRLKSIIDSGARCGVHTLISLDRRQTLPPGFDLADIRARSTTIQCEDGRWEWQDDTMGALPLSFDTPAPESLLNTLLHRIGEASLDATRVEVPFDVVAPPRDELWSRTCDRELVVPLGRCGATKLQSLSLGRGTTQHALLAGKTGSGKSTLLHVMITNLALWYSPDEVQFYLVDFKKGVEFKTYATHALPHAVAVAVESDREFGLSVLQRIDHELKERGDQFRDLGVQDLNGYRQLSGQPPMPRVLLIIDEFQELFVEDDVIGQESALLMDRVIRQGRAFGIHALLGSQTLGGAYTLARSTMGQMQIRIALQCSESDSYLIMNEDNAAARLLSRPGEAIYNDAGGSLVGNSPFQVVWLPDTERDEQLASIRSKAEESGYRRGEPTIVFEGNAAIELENNHHLAQKLAADSWPENQLVAPAWLGEAVAIKGPTEPRFQRQSGSNLLIVGQQDEYAMAMLSAMMLALAAHHPPVAVEPSRFIVFDGSPADSPLSGWLEQAMEHLPHPVMFAKWRDTDQEIAAIHEECMRRVDSEQTHPHSIYCIIFGLHRYRMLRATDDFSFSGDGDGGATTDRRFADILRDGPGIGIHTLLWCDTATNLNRTLPRQGLREFEMRVLFQLSGTDSTQLIDSPLATRLGMGRALYYHEEEGRLEKFRPYALPSHDWMAMATQQLRARGLDST